jgi:predicted phage tail protein
MMPGRVGAVADLGDGGPARGGRALGRVEAVDTLDGDREVTMTTPGSWKPRGRRRGLGDDRGVGRVFDMT